MPDEPGLITRAEYDKMPPYRQGFVVYMYGEWPGSELKGLTNPYPEGSTKADLWDRGNFQAMMAAQDSEE